jgi:small subunit ribosomal protein S2
LTNFKTIFKSIEKLNNLISLQLSDEIKKYSKKEQVMMSKEVERMGKFLGGIRVMRSLPQVIIVTDPIVEHNAVAEARQLGIPVIAFANTNANPELVDFLIPANTNSIRTVYLLISILCDAIAEAAGEPTLVIGKKDEEIILPEIAKREPNRSFIQHKRFTRGGYSGGGYNKPYNSAPKTTEK